MKKSRSCAGRHGEHGPKVAHFCSMCGPKFCSTKITQDIRDYAEHQVLVETRHGREVTRVQGDGSELYVAGD